MEVDKIETASQSIAPDRDIILYYSCPNEFTSTRITLQLKRKGFKRNRGLLLSASVFGGN